MPSRRFGARGDLSRAPQVTCHWAPDKVKAARRDQERAFKLLEEHIKGTMTMLLVSKKRRSSTSSARRKAFGDAARAAKTTFNKRGSIALACVARYVFQTLKRRQESVTEASGATAERIEDLAGDAARFITRQRTRGHEMKNAGVYAAALLWIMKSGHTVSNVAMIPRVGWVAKSVPGDMQFATAKTVGSRSMSAAIRELKDMCISGSLSAKVSQRFVLSNPALHAM